MASTRTDVRLLSVDKKNCELLDPRDPARSGWRIRFRLGRRAPSTAWRHEFEAELSRRELRRNLRYRYMVSPDQGTTRYRYAYARVATQFWQGFLNLFRSPKLFVEVDVSPGAVHVQLAHRELSDMIREANENVRRNRELQARAHIARKAALKSMGRAISQIVRNPSLPEPDAAGVLDMHGRQTQVDSRELVSAGSMSPRQKEHG
jgi:hypothetical protein